MRNFLSTCWHGKWSCGWEQWPNKPQFNFFADWYDGPVYTLHVGPLWIGVSW